MKEEQIKQSMERLQDVWDERYKEDADKKYAKLHDPSPRISKYKSKRSAPWSVAKAFKNLY